MTTSGAPTRPRFKRSSPRKKSQLRSRRLAAGEAEAAGGPALARAPLPSPLEVDAVPRIGHALPREFFEVDALDLAPRLLGKFLRRDEVILRITEVFDCIHGRDWMATYGLSRLAGYNKPVIGCLYQVLGQAPKMHSAPVSLARAVREKPAFPPGLARAGAGCMPPRSNLPAVGLTSMQPITCCLWPGWKKLATNQTYLACTGPGQPWCDPGSAGKGTNQALCKFGHWTVVLTNILGHRQGFLLPTFTIHVPKF